jgi:phosphate transport system permease protein
VTSVEVPVAEGPASEEAVPEKLKVVVRRPTGDRIFRVVARTAGGITLLVMVLVFFFLLQKSSQIFHVETFHEFMTTQTWFPDQGKAGVGSVLYGTVVISLIAIVLCFPFAVATALFITDYAPRRLQRTLTLFVDLLAAVPSIIFGIWGFFYLMPREMKLSRWLNDHFGWIPIFKVTGGQYALSQFIAGTVLAIMCTPIATSVMREVFSQAPPGEKEGALALGGTKWGMVRTVVLPFGRGGMVGAMMLALGRALGETIAVTFVIATIFYRNSHILQQGGNTIAALIALQWSEANSIGISALMAAGLVLFVLTLVVNVIASVITSRSRSGSLTEI